MQFRTLFVILISALLFTFCKKDEDSNNSESSKSNATDQGEPGANTIPGFGTVVGTLILEDGTSPAANAKISVESNPALDAESDELGNFVLENVTPGTLTIYAESSGGGGALTENIKAAQFKDILVVPNEATSLPEDIRLTTPGSISGSVELINNPQNVDLVGIDAYIPGTSYSAKTDAQGTFKISNVPAGVYDSVRIEKDGLSALEVKETIVETATDTNLGLVGMSLSNGPSGKILSIEGTTSVSINSKDAIVLASTDNVVVNLKFDSRATLMKLAAESAFINADWIPVATTFTFTEDYSKDTFNSFKSDGLKAVYVKFADLNGLESSVYKLEFYRDVTPPSVSDFRIFNGFPSIASTASAMNLDITATDTSTGIKDMIISNSPDFSGASWQSFQNSVSSWTPAPTTYLKVRDFAGNTSGVYTDSISVGSHTVIETGVYDEAFTFIKGASPYQVQSSVVFNDNVHIEAGVSLDYNGISEDDLTILGVLSANGTSAEPIAITNSGATPFNGFNLSTLGITSHSLKFVDFESTDDFKKYVKLDGGNIENCMFETSSGANEKMIEKIGTALLTIKDSVIRAPGSWANGIYTDAEGAQLTITGNDISAYGAAIYLLRGQVATIEYNTLVSTNDRPLSVNYGTITASYNVLNATVSRSFTQANNYFGVVVANLNHNNHLITGTMTQGDVHIESLDMGTSSITINSDFDYFAGCDVGGDCTNPEVEDNANINASINVTNAQIAPGDSAWPTTGARGSGCVGHLCTGP